MGYILVMDSLHFFDGCYFHYITASDHMITFGSWLWFLQHVVCAWNGMFKGH